MNREELDEVVAVFNAAGPGALQVAAAEVILEVAQTRDGPPSHLTLALYQVANGLFSDHPELATRARKMADSIGVQATRRFAAYMVP